VAYLATGGQSKTVENVLLTLSSILRVAKSWDYACGSFKLADLTMPREVIWKEQRCFQGVPVYRMSVLVYMAVWIGACIVCRAISIKTAQK
jgi:hypothetical protein